MTLSIEQVFAKQNFFNNAEMYFEPVMNNGREFKLTLSNIYDNDVVLNAVKITEFSIPEDSPIYMEGYQMLSQTAGTMSKPIDIGRINEVRDYGLYTKDKNDGAHYGANYFITKVGSLWYLIGATSSFKTSIFFKLKDGVCQVYWDLENTIIAAGAEYQADFICVLSSRKDRKSTRLNSSHQIISYAVFCWKKKKGTFCVAWEDGGRVSEGAGGRGRRGT